MTYCTPEIYRSLSAPVLTLLSKVVIGHNMTNPQYMQFLDKCHHTLFFFTAKSCIHLATVISGSGSMQEDKWILNEVNKSSGLV